MTARTYPKTTDVTKQYDLPGTARYGKYSSCWTVLQVQGMPWEQPATFLNWGGDILHAFPPGTRQKEIEAWAAAYEQGRVRGYNEGQPVGADALRRDIHKLLHVDETGF